MMFMFILPAALALAEPAEISLPEGTATAVEEHPGVFRAVIANGQRGAAFDLPEKLPPFLGAWAITKGRPEPLAFDIDAAGKVALHLPQALLARPVTGRAIEFATATESGQLADGRIVFLPHHAELRGTAARVETRHGQTWIAVGTDPGDGLHWKYRATRPGTYLADMAYAFAGGDACALDLELAGHQLETRLRPTDGATRFVTATAGKVGIREPGEFELAIRPGALAGREAVAGKSVRIMAIVLRPTSEGKPIVQSDDGTITCHARDVTIEGVQVQYEPRPEKNTVGYWTNALDRIRWEFTVKRPGRFEVFILQGCGKDQGGSEVELSVGDKPLVFTVEDTGHFQNFVSRSIGTATLDRAGLHTVVVRPLSKAGVAVMDLREVRLVPIE